MASQNSFPTFERRDSLFTSLQCKPPPQPGSHYDLLSLLSIADQLNIDLFPITWMAALGHLGKGAQGQVQQALIDVSTNFAFKRSRRSPGQSDMDRYRAIISEMMILRTPGIKDHPNIVDLVGLGWDVDLVFNEVWPVLIFPAAPLGSLKQFLRSSEGRDLSLTARLQLCENILSAMTVMHSAGEQDVFEKWGGGKAMTLCRCSAW